MSALWQHRSVRYGFFVPGRRVFESENIQTNRTLNNAYNGAYISQDDSCPCGPLPHGSFSHHYPSYGKCTASYSLTNVSDSMIQTWLSTNIDANTESSVTWTGYTQNRAVANVLTFNFTASEDAAAAADSSTVTGLLLAISQTLSSICQGGNATNQVTSAIKVCPSPSPTPSTSVSATPSRVTPSATPSISVSPTPTISVSPTPSRTASPTISVSPTSSQSATPSISVSTTPSRTATPTTSRTASMVSPLAANSTFGNTEPTIDLSTSSSASTVAIRSSLEAIQVGNTTFSGITWAVSSAINSTIRTERMYEAQLDAYTNATQVFSFNANNASTASFSGRDFVIAAGSVKWSVNFSSATNASAIQGVTLRYRLSDIGPGSPPPSSYRAKRSQQLTVIERAENTPRANMTSYYLAVPASDAPTASAEVVVMVVEMFDVALVDDTAFTPIAHAVDVVSDSHYELELVFPAFNRSLYYDPSLGLGVLLGSSGGRGDDFGGGGEDLGLIVGVAVGVGVAGVLVVSVIVAGVVVAVRQKKRRQPLSSVVNFQGGEVDSGL